MAQEYEKRKKQSSEVIEGYLTALLDFYVSGYYLNLKTGKYYAIGQVKDYNDLYGAEGDWSLFDDYIRELINNEDQSLLTKVSRLDYIRERLLKEKNYSIEIRDRGTGTERWYRYTTMRGADADHAAISFMDVTDQVLRRQELERLSSELEEHNKQLEENQTQLEESAAEQEAQLEEITALNTQLENNQAQLEESAAEQEAQLEEITALNTQLENNQAELEASVAEQQVQIDEIQKLNRSLSEYNDAMANAGYGMWHIILKDGVEPRMQVNAKMAELLGIAGRTLSEEELYNAWYDQIVPEAIPSVQASVGEMMAGQFSENTYQWVHPEKGVIYVRCGGTCQTLEDGTNILSGYHADVTDIVYEEKKHNEELETARRKAEEKEKQISAAYGMIEGLSQDYHTIWLVDKETSRMQLIRSSGVSTIQNAVQMGKDLPEFDKGFDKYINTYVEPEDRERMHREIAFAEILRQLDENPGKLYAVNYLRRDDSGHVSYHQIAFANADTKDGVKQFVYGFRDVDQLVKEEQKQKEELQKALNLAQEATAKQTAQLEEITYLNQIASEYNNAMANAGYGMWHIILKDGVAPRMQANGKMAELLGISGKNLSEEELYNAWYDNIVPEAIPSVQTSVGEMLAGKFSENTYQWVHPTKGVIYVRCGGTADKLEDGSDYISGYHADVTDIVYEEKKQRTELENIKNAALMENEIISSISKMYFAIFRIDLAQNYYEEISSDNSVHIITGHEGNAQEKMNELCASFVTNEYRNGVREFFDLSTIEERLRNLDTIEYQYHATDGNWHEARFIAKKRNEKGSVTHILFVIRVISEVKQKELESQEALRKAKDDAEAANRAKSAFLFNMSHDIRTPMNAIIGYANLMKRNKVCMEKWPDYLDKILQSSDFLLGLINNVLEMARIESGKTILDEKIYSVDAFADNLYSVFSDEMDKKDLKFTKSVEVQHQYLYFDDVKLREIFLNILSNAQKYTLPGGSVDLSIKELPADMSDYVLIETTVADTGIGINEEFIPHIFEEFTREKNSSGNRIQGTGLGMPIVKKFVELMGGTIEVESKVGVGSKFIVTIPHRIADKPADIAKEENIDYSDFTGKRILIAEDNDLNAEIAMEILSESGFKVERAEDGVVCIDMLSRAEAGYYDLILMDIQMPNLDGYSATRRIRALDDSEKADIPIIAMTANAFEEDKHNALEAGMDGHVAKPIEIPVLMKTLAYLFKDRSAVRNLITVHPPKEDPVAHVKRIYFEMQRSKAVSVLPGGFFAYMAEQPEKLIFANNLCCSIWGCNNFEEFNELVGGSFKGIVHPDDYDRAEKEIWYQIDNGSTDLDQVKYRIIRKDGSVANIADYGRLVRDNDIGDIFYVFVAEILDEKTIL